MTGDLLCAIEKLVWIPSNVQRGPHPRNEIRDHWGPTLEHPFSFLVQGLSDDGEDNSPGGEEF